jgi:hypothetical protein
MEHAVLDESIEKILTEQEGDSVFDQVADYLDVLEEYDA